MTPSEKLTQAAVDVAHAASTLMEGRESATPRADGMTSLLVDEDDYINLLAALKTWRDAGQAFLESLCQSAAGGGE